ncbi:MAG: GntR family transcriptional regulator [Anaerolineae bacterium]
MSLLEQNVPALKLQTREELVVEALRSAIVRGTFKPGEKLDQQDLADHLGVSRSPIREALRTLAAEELVTIVAHRGVVVTERTAEELEELLFIRSMLEGAATRRAAEVITAGQLKIVEKILIKGERSDDLEEVLQLNNDFHNKIYEAFPQPLLIANIQQLRNKIAPYNRIYLDIEGRKDAAWADHRRIFEACVRHDGMVAEKESLRHLQQVFNGIQIANE